MSQHEHIADLIAKQLQGTATPQEAATLEQWLQSDAANRQEYEDMAIIWQRSGPAFTSPQFSTDAAWQKLDAQIAPNATRHTTPFRGTIKMFGASQRAVAAILVLAVVAIGGYWWYSQSQWQTFIAATQNETLTLPDQSVVLVRKGSSVKYPTTFATKERRVQLTGEAFFKVQHNENQPFFVTTGKAEVKVLGTSFLVNSTATTEEVVVVTGKVNVTDKKANGNNVLLTKGQRALLTLDRFYQEPVTDSNFIAWETGQLAFNNTTLPKVLQDIAHYYNVAVDLAPGLTDAAAAIHVTVQLNNQPLEQALEEIRLITGMQTKKDQDKIIFYRN